MNTQQGITTLCINRPSGNAIIYELACELGQALDQAIASESRAIMLTGTGSCFCAGMDLKVVPTYSVQQQQQLLLQANRVIHTLYSCPKPVVAAVNGHAIGAGLMLALSTDYRIATDQQQNLFGLTEARAGIPFPAAPAVVLSHELAPPDVRYLTLYSKNIHAPQAKAMGIFDELAPETEVTERALQIALDLASIPADAYAKVKRQFRDKAIQEMTGIVEKESDPMMSRWVSEQGTQAASTVLSSPPTVG